MLHEKLWIAYELDREVVNVCWSNAKERDEVLEKHELVALSKEHLISQYISNDHVKKNAEEIVKHSRAISVIM